MPLSNKEIFFESVLAEMSGEIAVFDIDRRYIYINPQAVSDPENRKWIIGKTDLEYCKFRNISVDVAKKRNKIFDKVLAERKVFEWEERLVDKNGNERFYLRRMRPILNAKGVITFLIGYGMEITEQKKLGIQLEENRIFLDQVLNSSPHLIYVKDIHGNFNLANKAIADLFCTTPEELIGRSNADLHSNNSEVEEYNANDLLVINEMKAIRFEEIFTKPNGEIIWFDTIKLPIKKSDGEIQILGLSTDITDRKLAEEKVKKSELRMIEAQELALIGNWEFDLLTYEILWSKGMYTIWEMDPSKEAPQYETLNQMVHPDDLERVVEALSPLNSGDSQMDITYRVITTSGIKHVRTIAKPIFNSEGVAERLIGTVMDITKEKNTEALLRFNELRLNEAQEMARSGSWEYDLKEQKNYLSPAAYNLLECDPSLPAPSFEEFLNAVYASEKDKLRSILTNLAREGGSTEAEYRVVTFKGNHRIFHSKAVAELGLNGQPVKLYGTMLDITDRKQAEEILRQSEQRLNDAQRMAKIGSWEYDKVNHVNSWSLGHYILWEMDPSIPPPDFDGFVETIVPEDQQRMRDYMEHALAVSDPGFIEYRIVTGKGAIRNMHSNAIVERDENGVVERIYGSVSDITEQKKTEEILLRNEQRLLETQELARVGSWQLDLETMETEWSVGTFSIFGISPSNHALESADFEKAIYPDDREALNNGIQQSIETGSPFEMEYRIVLPDGQIKNVQSRAKALKNQKGKVTRLIGSILDITEQKKTEEILLQKEQRLNEAQEMAKIGSWEIYPDYTLVWSHGCYLIWERDPALGPPSYDEYFLAIHPDDRERVLDGATLLFKEKVPKEMTYRILTVTGKTKVLWSQTQELLDASGKVIRYIGTISDITEQKKTEEILLQNEQRLNEAQEMAKMGSWELYPDHTTRWSSGCYSIWERDPALGPMPFEEFFSSLHPDDHHKIQTRTGKISNDAFDFESDFRIVTPSGKEKFLLSIVHVLRDEAGNVIKYIGTLTDITQQKKIEQELIDAKQEADESIRSKEYFFANVGHELRTPLNGILGMSRLLNKTELNSIQRNYIEILNNTASNLLMIINDILDISKIESGTLVMESINFNPAQIADTAVQTQMYKAEEKDLALRHLNEGELLPVIEGDPYRLNQILLNLLSNAIKFTEQGEVILNHKISAETEDFVTIEFSVSDTGIGIPEEALESIFESFTQVHRGPQNKYGGTGLGLSISKNLVEMQEGKIWVTSTPGKGSDFRFSIPYKKVSSKQVKKKMERIDPDVLGPLRILLAEDNRVNQYITEAILQDWGFKVDIASNGFEAVDFVKRNDYDLILMDIQMPELGGIEATKMIREMEDSVKAKLPIIAITANTTRQAHKKFLVEGLNDWLVKPFKEDTLFRKISLHIKGKERFVTTINQPRFPVRKKPIAAKEHLYDLSLLRRDARDNPQFMLKMLGIFIESIPAIIEKMQDHFNKGEMDAISNLAHKIKPTLDGAGIFSLRETIRNIENYRDKKRSREQLKNDIVHLEQVIAVVIESFKKEIEVLTV